MKTHIQNFVLGVLAILVFPLFLIAAPFALVAELGAGFRRWFYHEDRFWC
jgi:hypothetical protein